MNHKYLFIAIVFFIASSASFTLDADQEPEWVSIKLTQQQNGEKHSRGFMLYTTDATKTGAAFRCESCKLKSKYHPGAGENQ